MPGLRLEATESVVGGDTSRLSRVAADRRLHPASFAVDSLLLQCYNRSYIVDVTETEISRRERALREPPGLRRRQQRGVEIHSRVAG